MKFLLALIAVLATVDARSFFPEKTYEKFVPYNGDKLKVEDSDFYNEIVPKKDDWVSKKEDYYKYFYPTKTETYDPFYDPKGTYDFDTFTKYFTSDKVLSGLVKYFPVKTTGDETVKYYPVPKDVVEYAKSSKDLKETIRTLVKYYYNLPEDVKVVVSEKYDFKNVVKFLLEIYYDIPNVQTTLYTYYDIPRTVVTELKKEYDLKKIINHIIEKFYDFTPYEREFYSKKFYDIPSVVSTLLKVYYGIPQFTEISEKDVEEYYYEVPKKWVETLFDGKFDFVDVINKIVEGRKKLSDVEKEFYDKFFDIDGFVKFLVKTYYYGVYEYNYSSLYYNKKSFNDFLGKVYEIYYGYSYDPYNYYGGDYYKKPVDYLKKYLNTEGYGKYDKYNKDVYGFSDFFKKFFDKYYGGEDYGYYGSDVYYPKEFSKYYPGKDFDFGKWYPESKYPFYPKEYYPKTEFDFDLYKKSPYNYEKKFYPFSYEKKFNPFTYEKTEYPKYDSYFPEEFLEKLFKGKKF